MNAKKIQSRSCRPIIHEGNVHGGYTSSLWWEGLVMKVTRCDESSEVEKDEVTVKLYNNCPPICIILTYRPNGWRSEIV